MLCDLASFLSLSTWNDEHRAGGGVLSLRKHGHHSSRRRCWGRGCLRVTWSGVSAGFPGEEHVLQHLKPELQLRSKKAEGVRVFGGPRHEDASCVGLGVSGEGGAGPMRGVFPAVQNAVGGFGICSKGVNAWFSCAAFLLLFCYACFLKIMVKHIPCC